MKARKDKYEVDQVIIKLRFGRQSSHDIRFSLLPLCIIGKIVKRSITYCHSVVREYIERGREEPRI